MITHITSNETLLLNKGMGWVMHTSIEKTYIDDNAFIPNDKIQVVALLSSWAKLEPIEGTFDFQDLDDAVEHWSRLGKEIHLRISTDPMIYRQEACGVPQWVFETYHVPYQTKLIYGLEAKFPDYLHPVYLAKVHLFIDALCARYERYPNIVQMDLRGYGEWGEWHSGFMHADLPTHVEALRAIIRTWDHACKGRIPLVLSGSYEWRRDQKLDLFAPASYDAFKYQSAFDYALTKENITFRRDGVGGALKVNDYLLFLEYFEKHHRLPLTTEFFISYDRQKEAEDGVRGYFAEDALEEALALHPNYMMLMWDSEAFFRERQDLIDHGLRRMGYRLYPSTIQTTKTGDMITLRHTWSNDGVGRLYLLHEVLFKLTDEEGHHISTTDDQVNLSDVTEAQKQTYMTHLRTDGLKGAITLSVGIRLKQDGSMVKCPLENVSDDGFYPLITLDHLNS